jgi:hypothetical protein
MALTLALAGIRGAAPASAQSHLPYADVVRVAPNTLMVVGRELDQAKGEATSPTRSCTARATRST